MRPIRVLNDINEIEACARCGGKLKIIASIEEAQVIAKILAHLEKDAPDHYTVQPDVPALQTGPAMSAAGRLGLAIRPNSGSRWPGKAV